MRFDEPLDDVFRSGAFVAVLRALFSLPVDVGLSGREVARRARISHPTATGILESLSDQGLATVQRTPTADLYRLRRAHVASAPLAALFEWERGIKQDLIDFLRHRIRAHSREVRTAALFGSIVHDAMEPSSDIDLLVVCDGDKLDQVRSALENVAAEVRERYGNRLSPLIVHPGGRPRGAWRTAAEEGIPLIGSLEEVKRNG